MVIFIKSCVSRICYCLSEGTYTVLDLKKDLEFKEAIPVNLQRLTVNGKVLSDLYTVPDGSNIEMVFTLLGGKGGFGSMLRAIGAQIEKTTNREACRDLSGRRLRDINEEKRLKQWITKQADREVETKQRKLEKLKRLQELPKHQFNDPRYDKERSDLPQKIGSSLEEGLKKSKANEAEKRKGPPIDVSTKKPCMWLGIDGMNESDLSSDEDESEVKDNEQNDICVKQTEKEDLHFDLSSTKDLEALGEARLGE